MNWSQTTDPELRRPRRRQPGFFLGAPQLPAWLGSSVRPSVRPCTGRDVGQSDCAHRAQQPPGPGPAPHQCRRGLGRTPTAPAPAPQNVRHQPAWPRLGVGCGKGPPRPPPAPTNSHGPQGEPAQWAQAAALPCRAPTGAALPVPGALLPHGEPCRGTAPTLPVPRPPRRQDKGQSQRAPSTKPLPELRPGPAPSHPLAPRQPPLPWLGTGPPPSPGTLQAPGPSCSTADPRRHSRPRELSTPLPPRSSARLLPRGTHLTGHVLTAGVPRRSPPRGCAPRPGTGMSLPHASAQPRGIACAAKASQRTGGTGTAVAARARPGRLHRLTRGAAGAGVGPRSGLCSHHSTL